MTLGAFHYVNQFRLSHIRFQLWNGGGSAERSNRRAWQPDEARPRTSHLHRHNRKTTPRPWNLGRRVMAYTFGNGNGTQRQQNNIPIQERNGHRGWGWINPAFFCLGCIHFLGCISMRRGCFSRFTLVLAENRVYYSCRNCLYVKLWSLYWERVAAWRNEFYFWHW